MREIHLHGSLAEFGDVFTLDVCTAAEAIRALCVQLEGFAERVREGAWQVVRGSPDTGLHLGEDSLWMGLGRAREVHILPAIAGAGSSNGVGKVLLGAVMIGAAFVTSGATAAIYLGAAGAGMMVAGVAMMLSPTPDTKSYEDKGKEDASSFLFNGPVNTSHQGVPVPLIYGEVITGSTVVSAGMTTERIPVGDNDSSGKLGGFIGRPRHEDGKSK